MVSTLVLGAILLVSVFSVCTQMLMTSGTNRSQHMMSDTVMLDCLQSKQTCPLSISGHMNLFARVYPAIAPDTATLILSLITLVVFAWFLVLKNYVAENERLRAGLRILLRSLKFSFAPSVLAFAFSQGILHPKLHA